VNEGQYHKPARVRLGYQTLRYRMAIVARAKEELPVPQWENPGLTFLKSPVILGQDDVSPLILLRVEFPSKRDDTLPCHGNGNLVSTLASIRSYTDHYPPGLLRQDASD